MTCGEQAQEWSYRGFAAVELTEVMTQGLTKGKSVAYSANPADYDPRCVSCHRKYDLNGKNLESTPASGAQ